jgi:hypothetical protein
MDPFVSTIAKQSAVIAGAFLIAGLVVAAAYGIVQYSKLQYALMLNMAPSQVQ